MFKVRFIEGVEMSFKSVWDYFFKKSWIKFWCFKNAFYICIPQRNNGASEKMRN